MRFSLFAFATTVLLLAAPASMKPTAANTCAERVSTDPSVKLIRTEDAAIPGSPISQAAVSGDHIYVSGFLPLAPHTGDIVGTDIDSQTRAVLESCKTVIEAAGSHLGKVVKVNLKNITDYGRVNEIYADFFGTHRPARSAVAVADIPLGGGVLIELDMTARV
ncbi:hypothetical protein D9615_010488 [Tricholomella constricta]|uniref:Uncharacterized protein n=1 Tax=Tricholomella constricta TaxID=117010 RepID=A0A8H5LSI8_9AGAR|nr:hypothetical protein D9615_010488 [Tricholomella constricta]